MRLHIMAIGIMMALLPAGGRSREAAGDGSVKIEGELKQWHKVTLTLDGPYARERDIDPNPFTDYRFTVTFRHESGSPQYLVQGYFAADGKGGYDLNDIRKATLWGNLMAGGAGVEYYFGYQLPQNDLACQDFRSRDRSWDYCRIALDFFHDNKVPFWEMVNADALAGNPTNDNSRYCLAKQGEIYLVYLPDGGQGNLDLSGTAGRFEVRWFNPRKGGSLVKGQVDRIQGGGKAELGEPPAEVHEDWLAIICK